MNKSTYDLIVLGGGPAGVTAALRASELSHGAKIALIERNRMGGTCTNDGCVPTRALAKAARLLRDADQFASYGLIGAPPTVDLPALLSRTQQIVYTIHEKKQLIQNLQSSGVEAITETGRHGLWMPTPWKRLIVDNSSPKSSSYAREDTRGVCPSPARNTPSPIVMSGH